LQNFLLATIHSTFLLKFISVENQHCGATHSAPRGFPTARNLSKPAHFSKRRKYAQNWIVGDVREHFKALEEKKKTAGRCRAFFATQ